MEKETFIVSIIGALVYIAVILRIVLKYGGLLGNRVELHRYLFGAVRMRKYLTQAEKERLLEYLETL